MMTEEELLLKKQIDFNNQWPNIPSLEIESTKVFVRRLKEKGLEQLIVPMKLEIEKAVELFSKHKDVAKIFSTVLDVFDMLPMHPDLAFDIIWRALEISLKYLSVHSWSYKTNSGFDKILRKGCEDVIKTYCEHDNDLSEMFEVLFAGISFSSLRYLVARLFFKMDLSVSPQVDYVRQRAEDLIGKNVIMAIRDKYVDEEGNMDANNQRKAAALFYLILKGKQVNVNGIVLPSLDLSKRVELYISCIIYSSRCERFHGDHYSPLKSRQAELATYYEYYYFLLFSYAVWGIVMNKIQDMLSGPDVFSIDAICDSIRESLDRIKVLPNK